MTNAISLISAHFDGNLSAGSDQSSMPAKAMGQVAGSETLWSVGGYPSRGRNIRSWLTFWPNESAASQYLEQRNTLIPLLKTAKTVSTGLFLPFATHGDVNWIGGHPNPLPLTLAARPQKDAPVFIITSAGIGNLGPGALAFGQGTHVVRKAIQDLDTVQFEAQILADSPAIDGATLSMWDNLSAVMNFAYKNDPHKSAMDVMHHDDLVRGSFTRCLVKSFDGVWNGRRISI